MIGFFPKVSRIMWHLGTHKQRSDSAASLNHKLLCEKQLSTHKWCFLGNQGFDQLVNIFRNWQPVEKVSKETWGGNMKYVVGTPWKRILQGILIVFRAVLVLAFPREISWYQRLPLLCCSAIRCQTLQVEQDRKHEPPSVKTTVSLCSRTQIGTRIQSLMCFRIYISEHFSSLWREDLY